jgi:hypothetical protein
VNRKWLVGGVAALLAIVAVLALVGGGVVGRSIVPEPSTPDSTSTAPEAAPATVRFRDTLTDVSIAYPSTWVRRAPKDQGVRIIASSPDASAAVSVSVRKSGLDPVPDEGLSLPAVRSLADDLVRTVARGTTLSGVSAPQDVKVGGLPGYRYEYTYRRRGGPGGGHVHYVLFGDHRLIQIVLQAVPAASMPALQPGFDLIASTFQTG